MTIPEILTAYNIPITTEGEHSRQGWIQLDCPFCSKGSNYWRMGYPIGGRIFNCWACGPHSMYQTLILLLGISPKKCLQLLAGLGTMRKIEKPEHTGRFQEPKGITPLSKAHRRYIKKRGFDPDEIEEIWKVKGIGQAPRLGWRIWIPILLNEKPISWTTRSIGNQGTRYISASPDQETIPHKDVLYGDVPPQHSIMIVEGPLDAWAIGKGAGATFGTGFTPAQILKMIEYPIRTVIYDNEKQAQKQARRLINLLAAFPGENNNVILEAKDPGSASKTELAEVRKRFLQ